MCGNRATMVHHKRYHHIGNENLFEFISLCEYCHNVLHEQEKNFGGGIVSFINI